MPAARACAKTSRSTICSTFRPSTRQLINHMSLSQTPVSPGRQMTTLIIPLSPNMSARLTCRVKTFGSFSGTHTSRSLYRRVVKLNWVDLLISCTILQFADLGRRHFTLECFSKVRISRMWVRLSQPSTSLAESSGVTNRIFIEDIREYPLAVHRSSLRPFYKPACLPFLLECGARADNAL